MRAFPFGEEIVTEAFKDMQTEQSWSLRISLYIHFDGFLPHTSNLIRFLRMTLGRKAKIPMLLI